MVSNAIVVPEEDAPLRCEEVAADEVMVANDDDDDDADAAAAATRQLLNQMVAASPAVDAVSAVVVNNNNNSSSNIDRHTAFRSEEYLSRLQSFTAARYFAKPVCLSPILCAASGWEMMREAAATADTSGSCSVATTTAGTTTIDDSALLSCPNCKAVLMILIPRALSAVAKQQLARQYYQQQLWQAHAMACRHRKEAEYLIHDTSLLLQRQHHNPHNKDKKQQKGRSNVVGKILSPVVPTLLAGMLPVSSNSSSSLQLVEQVSAPWDLFRQRWMDLYPLVLALGQQQEPIEVVLPSNVLLYGLGNQDGDDADSSTWTLLARIVTLLRVGEDRIDEEEEETAAREPTTTPLFPSIGLSPAEAQAAETAAAIVLMGWDLRRCKNKGDHAHDDEDVIECVFCLSRQPLTVRPAAVVDRQGGGDDDDDGSPQGKRRKKLGFASKWNQPFSAHRYYCPWVCGFPRTTAADDNDDDGAAIMGPPLWQTLADRLLLARRRSPPLQQPHQHGADALNDILVLLRAGVSSQRMDLSPPKGFLLNHHP